MSSKTSKIDPANAWEGIDPKRLPQHVAVIMDGNRRWALNRLLPGKHGHKAGVETLRELVKACLDLGIGYLTVYAFSTENWNRSSDEVGYLWALFEESLLKEVEGLDEHGVRMRFIGEIDELNPKIRASIQQAESRTGSNAKLTLNIAMNYGGRREILEVVKAVSRAAKAGQIDADSLDETRLSSFFYTAGQPDPDLLIRTSGEQRISNYLLWQLAYTEIYITETLWPDFRRGDFRLALLDFQGRDRRFGARP
ncbi:di-trans,poly-cis-decaprenylcistransferase [bacterium]|nr:di-trans,poly-cis-decaprenylcistransferase [bacterium]